MKKEKIFNVILDKDLNGLSIGIKEKIIDEDGNIFTKPTHRRAFRKLDEDGEVNPNFEKEVDEFTGEKDFVENKINF